MRTLVQQRIKPYYLHHPDLVEGTGHLRVSLAEGQALVRSLRGRLSGLCQPVYVLDIPGGFGKVPAGQAWVEGPAADGSFQVRDPSGVLHTYREPTPAP
jgi:lysine 2,3-aminomutase